MSEHYILDVDRKRIRAVRWLKKLNAFAAGFCVCVAATAASTGDWLWFVIALGIAAINLWLARER